MVGYPSDWKVAKLSSCSTMFSGGTPSSSISEYYGGDIPWVSISDMTSAGKFLTKTEKKLTTAGFEVCSARMYPTNTLLFAMYASIGKCCIARERVSSSQAILGIYDLKGLDLNYLYQNLSSRELEFVSMGQTGTQANLSKQIVQEISVPLPPLPEQKRIAKVLDDVDRLIENLGKRIAKKRLIKKGIAQELLTAKRRLPGFEDAWKMVKLGDVAETFSDGDWIESKDQSSSGIRLIQTGNIGVGAYKDKCDKKHFISEETFKRLGCTEIFEGDVLVSRLPDPIGRACLLKKSRERRITAVDCTIIRFKDYDAGFFVAYTQAPMYQDVIDQNMAGSTRQRISRKALGEIEIPVPPLPEQRAIAKVLSDMDEEIANLEARQAKLKLVKKGMLQDLLTGKVRLKG